MKKNVIAVGLLAVVLFGFLAPQAAFAKQQKLGEAEAKKLFEYWDKSGANSSETRQALTIMKTQLEAAKKKSKKLYDLLQGGKPYYDLVVNLIKVYDLYSRWTVARDTKNITNAGNVMFDSIEFATGFLPGAYYYKAITDAGRTALKLTNISLGKTQFADRYAEWEQNPGYFTGGKYKQGVNGHPLNAFGAGWAFDPEYLTFAQAWFSLEWYSGMPRLEETGLLYKISEFIGAREHAKRAGIVN